MQERLASELAAVEKRKHAGTSKAVRSGTAVCAAHTQTSPDSLPAQLPSARLQISALEAALVEVQNEVQSKTDSLTAAESSISELKAGHDSLLRAAEGSQAQNDSLCERLRLSEAAAKAAESQYQDQVQLTGATLQQQAHLTAQYTELQFQLAQLESLTGALQASQAAAESELRSMTQRAEAAQQRYSDLEASNATTSQQLEHVQICNSKLELTQQHLQSLIHEAAQKLLKQNAADLNLAGSGSLLQSATALIDSLCCQAEAAQAEARNLTQHLQEAQSLYASEVEHLR